MDAFGVQEIKKKKSKSWIIITVISAVLLIAFGTIFFSFFFAHKKFSNKTLELGDNPSMDAKDYIGGSDWIVEEAVVDISDLDNTRIGTYKVVCKSWIYKFTYKIEVVDTTAPDINPIPGKIFVAKDEAYSPDYFLDSVWDLSGDCELLVNDENEITFESLGEDKVTVKAVDSSGNVSEAEVDIYVDTPPVIVGVRDFNVQTGSKFDPLKYVAAVDAVDGAITGVSVSPSYVDTSIPGTYELAYTACDNYGLVSEINAVITVGENDDYSTFQFSKDEYETLVDNDYFRYTPLDYDNRNLAVEMTEPCMVDIYVFKDGGYGYGSGFVYNITDEYIYFMSVDHVTRQMTAGSTSIMFYDTSSISLNVKPTAIRLTDNNEISLFRLPIADIPAQILVKLKQIYVDVNVYSDLSEGDTIVAFSKNWGEWNNKRDLINDLMIYKVMGELHYDSYYNYDEVIITNDNIRSGMSGCAVIDLKGRLVGLTSCSGKLNGVSRAYLMRIDSIGLFNSRLNELN